MLVHLCWGPVAQSLVRPLPVVELQVGIDPSSGLGDGLVSFQIHLLVLQRRFQSTPPSITTTLPQFGQFLGGNCFAEGKATKLSSVWSGRHEEVLKVPLLRTVVVILVWCIRSSSVNKWAIYAEALPLFEQESGCLSIRKAFE